MICTLDSGKSIRLSSGFQHLEDLLTFVLSLAVGDYGVSVDNNEVELDAGYPRIIALANSTRVKYNWDKNLPGHRHPSTLAGIATLGTQKWASGLNFYLYRGDMWQTGITNDVHRKYADFSTAMTSSVGHIEIPKRM